MRAKPKVSLSDIMFLFFITRLCFTPATVWPLFKVPVVLAVGFFGIIILLMDQNNNRYFINGVVVFLVLLLLCTLIEYFIATDAKCIDVIYSYLINFAFLGVFWGIYASLETDILIGGNLLVAKWYRLGIIISTVLIIYVEIIGGGDLIRDTAVSYSNQFSFRFGGFDFIYGLLIIYSSFLMGFLNWKKKISRFGVHISIIILILFATAITLSNFSTAFVLLTFVTLYCILPKRRIFKVLILSAVFVGLYFCASFIADSILKIDFLSELTRIRLSGIFRTISGEDIGVTYLSGEGQRIELFFKSLKAFFRYPVLGALTNNQLSILGGHTEWIETLARFGLFVFLPYLLFWKRVIYRIENNMMNRNSDNSPFRIGVVTALIIGLCDPMNYLVTLAPIFLFAPFVDNFFIKFSTKGRITEDI